ncbi:unnamed protein product [Closterium sp. NIES-65]|nr:unnamed protein product [Closterium sp. NIES-65]
MSLRRESTWAGLDCSGLVRGLEEGLDPVVKKWPEKGVTIASDMMSDRNGRAQANFLCVNEDGAVFMESVDCGMERKTGGYIASLIRPVITKVGPENVVALCMDGASNYAAATREIVKEWPHIEIVKEWPHIEIVKEWPHIEIVKEWPHIEIVKEWPHIEIVPCATHVLDLFMEDIGKMDWAKNMVSHHVFKDWAAAAGAKVKEAADKFEKYMLDSAWWKTAEFFKKLLQLPYVSMRKTDSTKKGMMANMYDLMLQLTEEMSALLEEDEEQLSDEDKEKISDFLKARWDDSLAFALHVAGRIFNPANQKEGIFLRDRECTKVMKEFLERAHDFLVKYKRGGAGGFKELQKGMLAYINGDGSFGTKSAVEAREEIRAGKGDLLSWWQWHGCDYPELADIARRTLAQPVSASSCEQNWAKWEGVHTARRNRLGSEKCRDLVYVAHNWLVVHNAHKRPEMEGAGIIEGNKPDPPVPEGYILQEEVDEEEEEEDKLLADEYVATPPLP